MERLSREKGRKMSVRLEQEEGRENSKKKGGKLLSTFKLLPPLGRRKSRGRRPSGEGEVSIFGEEKGKKRKILLPPKGELSERGILHQLEGREGGDFSQGN